MRKYPIELIKSPNWPQEMKCQGCNFYGWQWVGMTKLMFNVVSGQRKWNKCAKCGVGRMHMNDGDLAVFILK